MEIKPFLINKISIALGPTNAAETLLTMIKNITSKEIVFDRTNLPPIPCVLINIVGGDFTEDGAVTHFELFECDC